MDKHYKDYIQIGLNIMRYWLTGNVSSTPRSSLDALLTR